MSKSDEQIERDSTKKNAASKKRESFKARKGASVGADWGTVDAAILQRCIETLTRDGGAIRLGYTRDGGAFAIGIYQGDDRETVYISPNDDPNEVMKELIEFYE